MRWHERSYLRKKKVDYWFRRICDYLKSDKCIVVLKREIKYRGVICAALYCPSIRSDSKDKLLISSKPGYFFFNSIFHEVLHGVDNKLWELEVHWLAHQIDERISAAQKTHFLIILIEALQRHSHFHIKKTKTDKDKEK